MICIIRIRGEVGLDRNIVETLNRMRLMKKYTCVVINPTKENLGMLKKVKDHVAFGEINDKTFEELLAKRGQLIDKKKKVDTKKAAEEIKKGKSFEELNLKPFFRLHPPRKGIHSKLHYPKGVLGNNREKINDLVMRML
ncbi:uL30 family ribosomal protein [Candidatus Pacearchaeota archaeon]|nr:uL30 family ribosomal protein [Candidatus Pacearchaeota archaeon]